MISALPEAGHRESGNAPGHHVQHALLSSIPGPADIHLPGMPASPCAGYYRPAPWFTSASISGRRLLRIRLRYSGRSCWWNPVPRRIHFPPATPRYPGVLYPEEAVMILPVHKKSLSAHQARFPGTGCGVVVSAWSSLWWATAIFTLYSGSPLSL